MPKNTKRGVEGWTIEQLPEKLRACIDGDYRLEPNDLMRQAADEIERLRSLADDLARVLLLINAGPDSWGLVEEVQIVMARYREARS
jgi:hypothetical protein